MAFNDWNTDPGANVSVGGVNIAEGCPAGNVNNGIRQVMAEAKAWGDGLGSVYQPQTTRLLNISALAGIANHFLMYTSADTFATAYASALARSLLTKETAPEIASLIGAITVTGVSLTNPGYIRFSIGGSPFQIALGSATANADGYTNVNYNQPFPNASFPVVSGTGETTPTAQDNPPAVTSASVSGFSVYNAGPSCTIYYIAVGF